MNDSSLDTPIRECYDLLVVGGGIYGASAAYEAARRGLSVLLAERGDFGGAASSNSMKIVHGGLRYLQERNLARVVRSHRELHTLLAIAPHHVQPLRCRLVVDDRPASFRLKFHAGVKLYSAIAAVAGRTVPGAPVVPPSRYPCWYDGIVGNTEGYLLDLLHTAVALGEGRVAARNYCTVEQLRHERGRVVGAALESVGDVGVTGVLECTGAHRAGRPAGLAMNLIVDRLDLASGDEAIGLAHPRDGRFVFVVPWRGRSMIGTWERRYPHDPAAPLRLEPAWIEECLAWLAPVHPELAALERKSVRLVHAGLLPANPHNSERLSHTDRVVDAGDGRIEVLGTKYTTARGVASRAVDLAVRRLGLPTTPGAAKRPLPALVDRTRTIEGRIAEDPSLGARVLESSGAPSRAEVLFAIDNERARNLDDVLLRRTGTASAGHPGTEIVAAVAAVVRDRLGWSDEETRRQVSAFDADPRFPSRP